MFATGTIYIPMLDRMGQRTLNCLIGSDPHRRVWGWYADHGYTITTPQDIDTMPVRMVEERVSRLRQDWRRWIWGESALSWFLGPAGIVVGGPVLAFVLLAWSIDVGWAYGQNMDDPQTLEQLQSHVSQRLGEVLGVPARCLPVSRWARFAGTVILWGFGPEIHAADIVMAEIRREFRQRWEERRRPAPFAV